jgi:hypothetical protein
MAWPFEAAEMFCVMKGANKLWPDRVSSSTNNELPPELEELELDELEEELELLLELEELELLEELDDELLLELEELLLEEELAVLLEDPGLSQTGVFMDETFE